MRSHSVAQGHFDFTQVAFLTSVRIFSSLSLIKAELLCLSHAFIFELEEMPVAWHQLQDVKKYKHLPAVFQWLIRDCLQLKVLVYFLTDKVFLKHTHISSISICNSNSIRPFTLYFLFPFYSLNRFFFLANAPAVLAYLRPVSCIILIKTHL